VEHNDLPGSPLGLFVASYVFNFLLSIVVFFLFGGKALLHKRADGSHEEEDTVRPERVLERASADRPTSSVSGGIGTGQPGHIDRQRTRPRRTRGPGRRLEPVAGRSRILTLVGILGTALAAFVFGLDIGVVAITAAVILSLVSPEASKAAVGQIAWPTVLLITGIVTYVALMQRIGTIDWLGERVADIGAPLVAALLICFIGSAVSAFASTTGILAALVPLAVPFLLGGEVGAIGLIIALALSSSIRLQPVLDVRRALCGQLPRTTSGTSSTVGCSSGA